MRKLHFFPIMAVLSLPVMAMAQEHSGGDSQAPEAKLSSTLGSGNPAPSFKSFKEAYSAGNDSLKNRKFTEAAANYGAAEDLGSNPKAKSQAANAQGWAYLKSRKLAEAKKAFARAIEENADNKLA